jgi:hypothetical protein
MADIATIGTVESIKVGDDFCFISVRDEVSNTSEYFFVWADVGETSAYERILQSMHLSMLRDALIHRLRVEITHGETSSNVGGVVIYQERHTM